MPIITDYLTSVLDISRPEISKKLKIFTCIKNTNMQILLSLKKVNNKFMIKKGLDFGLAYLCSFFRNLIIKISVRYCVSFEVI